MRALTASTAAAATRLAVSARNLTAFGDQSGSVLGTSSLPANFVKSLQEDLDRENRLRTQGMGETLANCIRRAELSHMESPEADRKFAERLHGQVDDFFSKLPTPADPMRAALAKTPEELEENAAAEMVREAVREAYLRRLGAGKAEEMRLKNAMRRFRSKGFEEPAQEGRDWSLAATAAGAIDPEAVKKAVAAARAAGRPDGYVPRATATTRRREQTFEEEMADMADGLDEKVLRDEMAAMQKKMDMMEALLKAKKKE